MNAMQFIDGEAYNPADYSLTKVSFNNVQHNFSLLVKDQAAAAGFTFQLNP
jgi:hypothetical protein